MSTPISPEVTRQIADHVYAGRKIAAIKLYREHSDQGLKESKDFIEALEKELRARDPSKFTVPAGGKGCRGTAAMLLSIGALTTVLIVFAWSR